MVAKLQATSSEALRAEFRPFEVLVFVWSSSKMMLAKSSLFSTGIIAAKSAWLATDSGCSFSSVPLTQIHK